VKNNTWALIVVVALCGLFYWMGTRSCPEIDTVYEEDSKLIREADSLRRVADSLISINRNSEYEINRLEQDVEYMFGVIRNSQRYDRSTVTGTVDTGRYSTDSIITRFLQSERQFNNRDSGYYEIFRYEVRDTINARVSGRQ
tara:strand:- start:240 stop:665 length:426 start_codon:yes stop_codon:yes gene_type:complete